MALHCLPQVVPGNTTAELDALVPAYVGELRLNTETGFVVYGADTIAGAWQLYDAAFLGVTPDSEKPVFSYRKSAGQVMSSGANPITWETALIAHAGFASNAFTVPTGRGGNYAIAVSIMFSGTMIAANYLDLRLKVNSTYYYLDYVTGLAPSYPVVQGQVILPLNAGDVISAVVDTNATLTAIHVESGTICTIFSGAKL